MQLPLPCIYIALENNRHFVTDCHSLGVNSDSPPDISNSAVIKFMSLTSFFRVMSCSVLFLAGLFKIRMHLILNNCELNNMDIKKHWLEESASNIYVWHRM